MNKKILTFILFITSNIYSQNIDLNIGVTKSKNFYQEIGFELVKNKIIIPVTIEGKIYRFILDTGAPTIISKEINDLLKPTLINSISATDANGKKESLNVVSINSIKLGNVLFEQTAALVYDLNSNPVFKCFEADGFIGSNLLRNLIIQINRNKKMFILTDNIKTLALNKTRASKIQLMGNQSSPYLWIDVKGKDTGKERLLIDTGADGLYDISLNNYKIFDKVKIYDVLGESIGASSIGLFGDVQKDNQYKLLLPSLRINNTELKNVVTNTINDTDSRIGADLLKYGIMTIDFIHKRFYFVSCSSVIDVLEPDYGFSKTYNENKLIVGFVWDNQLKEKMKYGDEIIAINETEINDSNLCDIITGNFEFENQNTTTLKIKSGEEQIIELKIDKKLPVTLNSNTNK